MDLLDNTSLDLIQKKLWGVPFTDYLWYILTVGIAIILIEIFFRYGFIYLKKLSEKTTNTFDNLLVGCIPKLRSSAFLITFLVIAIIQLPLSSFVYDLFQKIIFLIIVFESLLIVHKLIDYVAKIMGEKIELGAGTGLPVFSRLLKFAAWGLAFLVVLSNFGFNVTSLIAGLGIGGIAIALAAQNVLGDIFASISLSVDQPFKIGDYIQSGDVSGVVENIGIKTTRIRTLSGEEVSIPNATLTSSEIYNYTRIAKRRTTIGVGATYDTPSEKLKKIPNILKEIVENIEKTEVVRSHFRSMGDFSLNFEVVFYSLSNEYDELLKKEEEVLYKIFDTFEKEGIEIAFPTQTVYVKKDS